MNLQYLSNIWSSISSQQSMMARGFNGNKLGNAQQGLLGYGQHDIKVDNGTCSNMQQEAHMVESQHAVICNKRLICCCIATT